MKAILRITLLIASVVIVGLTAAQAQRVLKGTVYMDGKPAAGITVLAHKGGEMMTSFDGKYEVEGSEKTKYIKFTFIDESKKLEIEGKSGNNFDFAFTGDLPSANGGGDAGSGAADMRSLQELMNAKEKGFLNEFSMYNEFYKQGDFKSARPHWKTLYAKYPKSTKNLYTQGGKMMEKMIDGASTDADRDKYLDEYMKLYDKRVKMFGQEGFVLGRKGTSWLKFKLSPNRENTPEGDALKAVHKTGYELLNKSIEMQANETEAPVLVLLMQTTVALFKLGELPKEDVVKNYEKVTGIANAVIAKNEDADQVKMLQEKILPVIETLFGKSGAADCDALINIYTPEYAKNNNDADYIKKMLRRLGRAGCTESELFAQGTERLYELDPSAEAAFNMARRFVKKDDVANAKKYYKMAMEQETDQELLATYYYEYGLFIYAKESLFAEARSYARKALAINPNYCEANMLIGNIYVAASQKFNGSELEKSAIFWLAVDYFNKARRSEDCSIDAAANAAKYKKYFPNKETAFMEGLKEGASHKVGGWINESTKVRF